MVLLKWLFWLALGAVWLLLWLFLGTRTLCPSCGAKLGEDSFSDRADAFVGERHLDHCRRCGWRKYPT